MRCTLPVGTRTRLNTSRRSLSRALGGANDVREERCDDLPLLALGLDLERGAARAAEVEAGRVFLATCVAGEHG